MTLPLSYHRLTPEDRLIVSGSWRRGMANGGGPGLLSVATLMADTEPMPKHRMDWRKTARNRVKMRHDDTRGPISATLWGAVY